MIGGRSGVGPGSIRCRLGVNLASMQRPTGMRSRAQAIGKLSGAPPDVAIKALLAALHSGDSAIRVAAVEATARLAGGPGLPEQAILALAGASGDRYFKVRVAAAQAISRSAPGSQSRPRNDP